MSETFTYKQRFADQQRIFREVPYTSSVATQVSLQERIKDIGLVYADIESISSDDLRLYRAGYLAEGEVRRK